mgnify:CR=1 FL=1
MSAEFKDNHHGCYDRASWRLLEFTRRIREHPGMILHGIERPIHVGAHKEIGPVAPPGRTLAIIALAHLNALGVQDGREGFVLQADFLWYLSNEDTRLGEEAYMQANHLEQQIEYFGLRKAAA